VPGWFYQLMRFVIRSGYAERRGKGVVGFLIARERYIDDYLAGCLQAGVAQMVILGAGYDSRACRFPDVRTFEVDHPATQQVKMAKVREVFGQLPGNVTFAGIDFNRQSLEECLAANGYDPERKSIFIWQGVTYYLDPTAVDGTLGFIANHSAPGSSVIFDYIDPALLARPAGHGEVRGMRRFSGMTGENLRFGIPVTEIEAFLTQRGFGQVQNIRSEELKIRYFHGKNQSRNVMSGYAIVSAVVW
jgi:methyltransferase (TIGR00027 family)